MFLCVLKNTLNLVSIPTARVKQSFRLLSVIIVFIETTLRVLIQFLDRQPQIRTNLTSLFARTLQPSAQSDWTPLCPPVVDSEGFVIFTLAASAFSSGVQTFIRFLVLDQTKSSASGEFAPSWEVLADLSLPGSYSLSTQTGRRPAYSGITADNHIVASWISGEASALLIQTVIIRKTGDRKSKPVWSFPPSIPLKFGPLSTYVFKPLFSGDRKWLFMPASNAGGPCLLRYNISASISNQAGAQECKAFGDIFPTVDDFTPFSQFDTEFQSYISSSEYDLGANQPFFIASRFDVYNASFAKLPLVSTRKTTLTQMSGTVQLNTFRDLKGRVIASSRDNVTMLGFPGLQPYSLFENWSLTNSDLKHNETSGKAIVAMDEKRGWIYVCVNMTQYTISTPNVTNTKTVGPVGPLSGVWNGSLIAVKNTTGERVFGSDSPDIRGCSISSVLILRNNGLLISGPSDIVMYEVDESSFSKPALKKKWSVPVHDKDPQNQLPYLVSPTFLNSTMLTGTGDVAALTYTYLPSPTPPTPSPNPNTPETFNGTLLIALIIVAALLIALCVIFAVLHFRRRKRKNMKTVERSLIPQISTTNPDDSTHESISTASYHNNNSLSPPSTRSHIWPFRKRSTKSAATSVSGSITDLEMDNVSNRTPVQTRNTATIFAANTTETELSIPTETGPPPTRRETKIYVGGTPENRDSTSTPNESDSLSPESSDFVLARENDGISTQTDPELLKGIKGNPNLIHGVGESDRDSSRSESKRTRHKNGKVSKRSGKKKSGSLDSSPPTRPAPSPSDMNPNYVKPMGFKTNFENTSESQLSEAYFTAPETGDSQSMKSFDSSSQPEEPHFPAPTLAELQNIVLPDFNSSYKSGKSYLTADEGYYASVSESSMSIRSPQSIAELRDSESWQVRRTRTNSSSSSTTSTIRPSKSSPPKNFADSDAESEELSVDLDKYFGEVEIPFASGSNKPPVLNGSATIEDESTIHGSHFSRSLDDVSKGASTPQQTTASEAELLNHSLLSGKLKKTESARITEESEGYETAPDYETPAEDLLAS
ncbi:hypothetical protein HK098_004470 [Nowakowskiella sp. JEL0407]|nr:hypothetical protein HK098_004470 [Nowakowskiella sp. JEL0407]